MFETLVWNHRGKFLQLRKGNVLTQVCTYYISLNHVHIHVMNEMQIEFQRKQKLSGRG